MSSTTPAAANSPAIGRYTGLLRDIVLVALVTLLLTAGVVYAIFQLSGIQFFRVSTPSMTPTLSVGEVVAVRSVQPHVIEVGDIIAFRHEGQPPIIHRVDSVSQPFPDIRKVFNDNDGNFIGEDWDYSPRTFRTKGDANAAVDVRPVPQEQLLGRLAFEVPFPFSILARMAGRTTLIIAGSLSLALYVAWQGWDAVHAMRRRRTAGAGDPVPPDPEPPR